MYAFWFQLWLWWVSRLFSLVKGSWVLLVLRVGVVSLLRVVFGV